MQGAARGPADDGLGMADVPGGHWAVLTHHCLRGQDRPGQVRGGRALVLSLLASVLDRSSESHRGTNICCNSLVAKQL